MYRPKKRVEHRGSSLRSLVRHHRCVQRTGTVVVNQLIEILPTSVADDDFVGQRFEVDAESDVPTRSVSRTEYQWSD